MVYGSECVSVRVVEGLWALYSNASLARNASTPLFWNGADEVRAGVCPLAEVTQLTQLLPTELCVNPGFKDSVV